MSKLKVGKQCQKCPWKVSVDPNDIPNGYDIEKHKNLKKTISEGLDSLSNRNVMACHETHNTACAGWVHNQLGVGNNWGLRVRMRSQVNKVEIFGKQHESFKDTLPAESE